MWGNLMAKRKIKKSIINMILDAYSIRPKEFETIEGPEGDYYRSKVIKGYQVGIELEKIEYLNAEGNGVDEIKETGRIVVHHSDSKGKRVFNDIWENDGKGGYYWLCRNPINKPFNDYRVIRDLEDELKKVKAAARELQKEYNDLLSQKINAISDIKKRGVGRPKETDKQKAKAAEIQKLVEDGKSNDEIMETLNITRATFFRLKKLIGKN